MKNAYFPQNCEACLIWFVIDMCKWYIPGNVSLSVVSEIWLLVLCHGWHDRMTFFASQFGGRWLQFGIIPTSFAMWKSIDMRWILIMSTQQMHTHTGTIGHSRAGWVEFLHPLNASDRDGREGSNIECEYAMGIWCTQTEYLAHPCTVKNALFHALIGSPWGLV